METLDGRIASALEALEEAEKARVRDGIAKRRADAVARAEIVRLKAAAVRDERDAAKFRKWDDSEFKRQFERLDVRKADLDNLSEASDLDKAKLAAADVHSAAVWIAENAAAREGLDAVEREIGALNPELEKAEAKRYARSALYKADTAREEAVRRRDLADFTGAKAKFEEAKGLYGRALDEARKVQASAKAGEALADASAAKIRGDWENVLSNAGKALMWEPGNAEAKKLKGEAEAALKRIQATAKADEAQAFEPGNAEAKKLEGEAEAALKRIQASAKASEALMDASVAKIRGDWGTVLTKADEALAWEPGNAEAKKLKGEAEAALKPYWAVSATLPDGVAATGAKLTLGGRSYNLPVRLSLAVGSTYGPGEVTLERGGKTFVGEFGRITVGPDWKGERATAVALQERRGLKPGEPIDLGGGVKLEMVYCPGVAPDFWMGKYEVTQEQWKRVMGTDPSHFKGDRRPVEIVSWNDCKEFVDKLNKLRSARASGLTFRLPTSAEWETACRAGAPKSADYCLLADGTQITAGTLSRVAHYGKGWDDGTTDVGSLAPNAWGLHDMHGNVREWTETAVGGGRVFRGGGYSSRAVDCTAGFRSGINPDYQGWGVGFRLAASGRAPAQ